MPDILSDKTGGRVLEMLCFSFVSKRTMRISEAYRRDLLHMLFVVCSVTENQINRD